MTTWPMLVLSAAALVTSTIAGHAGVCSQDIDFMQARIDAKLEALAAAGPLARESTGALMHRQPTPGSIAAAESRLGETSTAMPDAVTTAMARAREADRAGDKAACEQALADVERTMGP
jgi:hypothetical protein